MYRRRRRKRGNWRNTGFTGRFSKSTLKPEKKFLDTNLGSTTIASTGTSMQNATTDIIEIVNGTGENERNGSRVRLKSLHLRSIITLDATTTTAGTFEFVRILIGIDKQANKAAVALSAILEGSSADIHNFRDMENLHRFIFLYDKTFCMNTTAFGSNGTTHAGGIKCKYVNINLTMNVPIYYTGSTGAVTEIASHNLWAFAISESGRAKMINFWRVRFYG